MSTDSTDIVSSKDNHNVKIICVGITAVFALAVCLFWGATWLADTYHDNRRHQELLTFIEKKIAGGCSADMKCRAVLNDGTNLPLRMVGDINQTWIILGEEKMETSYFLKKMYNQPYPKGVNDIKVD